MNRFTTKIQLKAIALILSAILLGTSCSKKDFSSENDISFEKNDEIAMVNSIEQDMAKLPKEVTSYYDNIKSLMYATNAFEKPTTSGLSAKRLSTTESNENAESLENPIVEKLSSLNIQREEGQEVDFYDLAEEEKQVFVDLMLVEEAKILAEKAAQAPEIIEVLAQENKATNTVITEKKIRQLRVGQTVDVKNDLGFVVKNTFASAELFNDIKQEHEKEYAKQNLTKSGIITYPFNYPKVNIEVVKNTWQTYAKRGNFVVALPLHGNPWTYLNIGKNVRFKVGHAAILNKKITASTNINDDYVTIEAYAENGVEELKIENWDTPHYIMGIQKTCWVWRWRGFRSGLYREVTRMTNTNALADEARHHLGKEYVKWYEFATAKWAAPRRFTCTTLVWWCSKKAYGVNVSSWYSPLVTPSGLFTDCNTYLIREVR